MLKATRVRVGVVTPYIIVSKDLNKLNMALQRTSWIYISTLFFYLFLFDLWNSFFVCFSNAKKLQIFLHFASVPVWPEKNCRMSIKVAQNDRFWNLYKNCLRMWEIWANLLLPKALKSCPKYKNPQIWSHWSLLTLESLLPDLLLTICTYLLCTCI